MIWRIHFRGRHKESTTWCDPKNLQTALLTLLFWKKNMKEVKLYDLAGVDKDQYLTELWEE